MLLIDKSVWEKTRENLALIFLIWYYNIIIVIIIIINCLCFSRLQALKVDRIGFCSRSNVTKHSRRSSWATARCTGSVTAIISRGRGWERWFLPPWTDGGGERRAGVVRTIAVLTLPVGAAFASLVLWVSWKKMDWTIIITTIKTIKKPVCYRTAKNVQAG